MTWVVFNLPVMICATGERTVESWDLRGLDAVYEHSWREEEGRWMVVLGEVEGVTQSKELHSP